VSKEVKKLYRSRKDKMIAGICGGIGEIYSFDPTIVRLVYALITIFSAGTALLVYILGWIIIPEEKPE
jgi:phage shock protein C